VSLQVLFGGRDLADRTVIIQVEVLEFMVVGLYHVDPSGVLHHLLLPGIVISNTTPDMEVDDRSHLSCYCFKMSSLVLGGGSGGGGGPNIYSILISFETQNRPL